MTRQELIDTAILDALGMLDDEERAAFEAAFRAAPPSVQAHVRREQTRLARIESLLPQVEAPPGLRARVLAVVRAAIAQTARAAGARRAEPRPILPLMPVNRVSSVWRTLAYGFATAAAIALLAFLMVRDEFQDINHRLEKLSANTSVLNTLGDDFAAYLGRDGLRVANFRPAADGVEGVANLFFDRDTDTVYLQVSGLPVEPGRTYRLVIMDESGRLGDEVISFDVTGGYETPRRAVLSLAELQGLAIVAVDGQSSDGATPLLTLPSIQ